MAADLKIKYGTANQAITLTLNALADNAARASAFITNAVNLYIDCLLQLKIDTGNVGAPSGEKNVLVYAYGSSDDGTTFSGGATGSDAAYGAVAGQLITNLKLIDAIDVDAQNEVFESDVYSIASAFGGSVPMKWGIVVLNQIGQALSTNSGAFYQGVFAQSI